MYALQNKKSMTTEVLWEREGGGEYNRFRGGSTMLKLSGQ